MNAEEYLKILTEQIRSRKARNAVQKEIKTHIEEQRDAFLNAGFTLQEAERAAVEEMGDPVDVGNEMNRIHRPRMAWGMICLIALLNTVGLLVQYFMQIEGSGKERAFTILMRHGFAAVCGFLIMIGVCYLDYSRVARWAKEFLALIWIAVLSGNLFFGIEMNGARRWAGIGDIAIDLRWLLFLTVPLYGAILYTYRGQDGKALKKGLLFTVPSILLAVYCSSMITAAALLLTFAVMLTVIGYKKWFRVSVKKTIAGIWLTVIGVPVMLACFILLRGSAYRQLRLAAIVDPSGAFGYQARMFRELLSKSQWLGENKSALSIAQIPADGEDYILTYVISTFGILAAAVAVGCLLFLFLRLLNVAHSQKNQLGMIMGIGCGTAFLVQVLVYSLSNLGIGQSGMYCPFMMNSTSGIVVTYILLGMLLSIYRYQNVIAESSFWRNEKRFGKFKIMLEK